MPDNRGFTLWEIMIVIAIIAILAGLAVPNLFGSRNRASLKGTLDNLRGDLQIAKSLAIREGNFVVVNFATDRYEIFVDNGSGGNAGNWVRDADEQQIRARTLSGGVTIDLAGTDLDADRTRFNDRGLPDNLGSIVLSNSAGDQRRIRLNRLGRLIIE